MCETLFSRDRETRLIIEPNTGEVQPDYNFPSDEGDPCLLASGEWFPLDETLPGTKGKQYPHLGHTHVVKCQQDFEQVIEAQGVTLTEADKANVPYYWPSPTIDLRTLLNASVYYSKQSNHYSPSSDHIVSSHAIYTVVPSAALVSYILDAEKDNVPVEVTIESIVSNLNIELMNNGVITAGNKGTFAEEDWDNFFLSSATTNKAEVVNPDEYATNVPLFHVQILRNRVRVK